MTALELAEQCEQATGPNYVLETQIWDAVYPGEREERWQKMLREAPGSMTRNLGPADRDGYIKPLRAFTVWIDAAATLVPEGWDWSVGTCGEGRGGHAFVRQFIGTECDQETDAATPALALCAAALLARAQDSRSIPEVGGGEAKNPRNSAES